MEFMRRARHSSDVTGTCFNGETTGRFLTLVSCRVGEEQKRRNTRWWHRHGCVATSEGECGSIVRNVCS